MRECYIDTKTICIYSRSFLHVYSIIYSCFWRPKPFRFQRRGGLKGPDDDEEDDKAWLMEMYFLRGDMLVMPLPLLEGVRLQGCRPRYEKSLRPYVCICIYTIHMHKHIAWRVAECPQGPQHRLLQTKPACCGKKSMPWYLPVWASMASCSEEGLICGMRSGAASMSPLLS